MGGIAATCATSGGAGASGGKKFPCPSHTVEGGHSTLYRVITSPKREALAHHSVVATNRCHV
jgi:hypothetical protein